MSSAAAAPASTGVPVTAANAVVSIAGRPVLRFRTALGGVPPDQRADIVALRLQEKLAQGADPRSLRTVKEGRAAAVFFGNTLLLRVTPAEARAQQSLPAALAGLWTHRLRALLTMPPLTVSRQQLTVPLGERRSLTFGGLLRSVQSVSGEQGTVAVTLGAQGRSASVRGLAAGDTRLVFANGQARIAVAVRVRPYAGHLPKLAEAAVTGRPAPAELVERVAIAAVKQALSLQPGASGRFGPVPRRSLRPGHYTRLAVPVRLSGPGCLPVAGKVPVVVRNQRLPAAGAPRLFYSNHPERVKGYGTLFLGRIAAGQPARLLYHHQNAMGRRFALTVDLVNPGDQPVRLHVIEGTTRPFTDPMSAGHFAARSFLRHQRAGIGYITVLPPRSLVTIAHHLLPHGKVASGLFGLRQLAGDSDCLVQVKVVDPLSPFVRPPESSDQLSATIFNSAVKPVAAVYEVGGQWSFIRLGSANQRGPSRLSEEGFGDYGVTYDISLTMINPTEHARKVGLVFEAASGKARGLFVVDGKTVETRALNAHDELVLAVYTLPPGGMRNVRVTTLPLSGSAYPARLVLRELPRAAAIRPGTLLRPH
jgi:hypothetical protein